VSVLCSEDKAFRLFCWQKQSFLIVFSHLLVSVYP
jgi:hypothetical protein